MWVSMTSMEAGLWGYASGRRRNATFASIDGAGACCMMALRPAAAAAVSVIWALRSSVKFILTAAKDIVLISVKIDG
ncbi:hypothetical protein D3C83_10420 [compost metagenome]